MSLLTPRYSFEPIEYNSLYEHWINQQAVHWTHLDISFISDVEDWKYNLTESEKNVIANVLQGFVLTELHVENYWNRVAKWFPKPEVLILTSALSNMEGIHTAAYNMLQSVLNLSETTADAWLQEPTAKAKIDRLLEVKDDSLEEIAQSLAIFSAFTEGTSLFSQFLILVSFSRRNLLRGVSKVIEYSARDESLHSSVGCELFRILCKEQPHLLSDELKKSIYDAARLTIQLEDNFIDKVFELGPIQDVDPKDLKNYIRFRANSKLQELGLKSNWKNIDKESLKKLNWFDVLISGMINQDFFSQKETGYAKNVADFDDIWEDK